MVRSTAGNNVPIFTRITAHKNALAAVLHAGMARGHRGNPAASLRIHQLYGVPVLLSGIATLVLSKQDQDLIDNHHKDVVSNLLRLFPRTPRAVILFLAGSLPGSALLHLRQLSIFGMICRLPQNIINTHAQNIFSYATSSSKSWFKQISELCLKYDLPHPNKLLKDPMPKETYKRLIKSHVTNYWESVLRTEAANLPSLSFFRPQFMSLAKPHPMWSTAGSSPAKIAMATIQCRMVSGRYRTQLLCSHWSNNKAGFCQSSPACSSTVEDIKHILTTCHGLHETRLKLINFTQKYCTKVSPAIRNIIENHCTIESPTFCQFLLDCSVLPQVITATQQYGSNVLSHVFHITRTWVYTLHKQRMKLLGRWNLN